MDHGSDESVLILREIWNEMKALNGRVDRTNNGIEVTNQRLDQTNQRLDGLVVEVREGFRALRSDVQRLDGRIENLLLGAHAQEHLDFRERIVRLEVRAGIEAGARSP